VFLGPDVTVISLDDNLPLALANDNVLVVLETEMLDKSSAEFGFSVDAVEDLSTSRVMYKCVEESADSVDSNSVSVFCQSTASNED
jgi:transposase